MTEEKTACPSEIVQRDTEPELPGRRCCGATTRSGSPCRTWVGLGAGGKCKLHGGLSPRGPASASWKHGRYSRYLPSKLRNSCEALERDPNALSLRPDIALVTARLQQILSDIGRGHGTRDVIAALNRFKSVLASGDRVMLSEMFRKLEAAIHASAEEQHSWREALNAMGARRQLVEAETARVQAEQTSLSASDAYALVYALVDLVKTHVSDATARRAIADGVSRLLGRLPRTVN